MLVIRKPGSQEPVLGKEYPQVYSVSGHGCKLHDGAVYFPEKGSSFDMDPRQNLWVKKYGFLFSVGGKGLTTIEARNIEGELGASIKGCAIQRLARGGGLQVKLVALRLALETPDTCSCQDLPRKTDFATRSNHEPNQPPRTRSPRVSVGTKSSHSNTCAIEIIDLTARKSILAMRHPHAVTEKRNPYRI